MDRHDIWAAMLLTAACILLFYGCTRPCSEACVTHRENGEIIGQARASGRNAEVYLYTPPPKGLMP